MKHHDEAVKRYIARVKDDPDVVAVVVSGSLARGTERDDSDIDLYLVVTEEAWQRAVVANRIMVVETEGAEYDRGYFDIKLATLRFLREAAERGDDPVRDSFASALVAWSSVPNLAERISRIGLRDAHSWQSLEDSFLAQARLHGGYFLHEGERGEDALLLHHAAVHLATSACRALLARNRVLFSGPKYLTRLVAGLKAAPVRWGDLLTDLLEHPSAASGDRLIAALEAFLGSPQTFEDSLSIFVTDNELAWRTRDPPPEYR